MSTTFRSITIAALTGLCGALLAGSSVADDAVVPNTAGRAAMYGELLENSLESTTSPDHIRAVTKKGVAPTAIWRALEHGEKVECLGCIPDVSKLLYDSNSKTREISAWWLRRRIFGVFGPGQVYSQVIDTLKNDASEIRRARAADALGEFLVGSGVPLVANAAINDSSVLVRVSAVKALQRLNNEGPAGELGTAMSDSAPEVRLAALRASTRVHAFTRVDAVVALLGDSDADVRRTTAEVLGTLRSADAVTGLIALTSPDQEADPRVRTSAVAALGKIGDPAARDAVVSAEADPDALVRSVARISLRRL